MKSSSLKKIALLLSCFVLCFLFNASVSRAEQPDKDLTKTMFSGSSDKTIKGLLKSTESLPVVQAIARARDMASSFNVKFALTERFKAFLSIGQPHVEDLAGRDINRNPSYNASFGFLITLQ